MKIIDALKPTGKAWDGKQVDAHVKLKFNNGANYLVWINNKTGEEEGRVAYEPHFCDYWQPYHEVKEIRPEKPGETWEYLPKYEKMFTFIDGALGVSIINEIGRTGTPKDIVHGENGWRRIEPPVKEAL